MNTEWITDRLPKYEDGFLGLVWYQEIVGLPNLRRRNEIKLGMPWMPIKIPASYVKPEPQRWKPNVNEIYFSVVSHCVFSNAWLGTSGDHDRYAIGNCFQTEAQAQEAASRVRELLLNYHKELNNE
jgi:hypothetical protein